MLMDLGANVYSEDFEQQFLSTSAEFYQVEAIPHHQHGTCLDKLTADCLGTNLVDVSTTG
jgi:hypothetical protein